MKINYFLLLLFCLGFEGAIAQLTFHQDIFYGGVTMGGFSTDHQSYGSTGNNPLELYIEPGSTIRNAYLFHYQVGPSITSTVTLNGTEFVFTGEDEILNVGRTNPIGTPVRYLYKDITDYLNANLTEIFNIEVECVAQSNYGGFSAYLYIEYENPILDIVCSNFVINNQFIDVSLSMNISELSSIDVLSHIGLACYYDNIGNNFNDWEAVTLNNNLLGIIGGADNSNSNVGLGPGVRGHFYYQNNLLFGLDDDTPNNIMDSTDALANISNYITNINSYELTIYNTNLSSPNYPLFFVNAYSTPCDTFSTTITVNQTICQGDSVLLSVSGGNSSYSWSNNTTLSDSLSSFVFAMPDITSTYIAKIENEPGCYRTEQVTVFVNPAPVFESITVIPTVCGNTPEGMIQINVVESFGIDYSIDNDYGDNNTFNNLSAGTYQVSVIDNHNCRTDTTVFVSSELEVVALFEATPLMGDEPLLVNITNLSNFANNYNWSINGSLFSNEEHPSVVLDTNGMYQVEFIAYNNILECADTFSIEIIVHNALTVQIPNIFTPNNDGLNDVFSVITDDVKLINMEIFNRWGNSIYNLNKSMESNEQTTVLWDGKSKIGKNVASGTYYYIIEVVRANEEKHTYQGNIMMIE